MTEFELASYSDVSTSLSSMDNRALAEAVKAALPSMDMPYTDGKTAMRTALVERVGCSELDAEQAIDHLERLGVLEFRETLAGGQGYAMRWIVHPVPMPRR